MRKVDPGIYRGSAWKMKQRSIRDKIQSKNDMCHAPYWLPDNLSNIGAVHGIRIETVDPQSFEPSSPELWPVIPLAWNCHPIGPSFQGWWTHVVKGATKEDKNIAWRALLNGPDGSMSMGR